MSVISISAPNASIAGEKGNGAPGMFANTLAGYKIAMAQEDAVRKCLLPSNLDTLAEIMTSRELVISQSRNMSMRPPNRSCVIFGIRDVGGFPIRKHCLWRLQR